MRISVKRNKNNHGVYVILLAIMSVLICSVCALVVGVAFISSQQSKFQEIANVVALAAIEAYARSTQALEIDKREEAKNRAESILKANHLLGVSSPLGNLSTSQAIPGTSGYLLFGEYFPEDPDGDATRLGLCSGRYPCFLESTTVNAINVVINTQSTNRLIAPFLSLFAPNGVSVQSHAIGTLVQRCTAFLLDVSRSTAFSSHYSDYALPQLTYPASPIEPFPAKRIAPPAQTGIFAVRSSSVLSKPIGNNAGEISPIGFLSYSNINSTSVGGLYKGCSVLSNLGGPLSQEKVLWCNTGLEESSVSFRDIRTSTDTAPSLHFKSDYRLHPSFMGLNPFNKWLLMDAYVNPEPLSQFMLAFNAALRQMKTFKTNKDAAMAIAFTKTIRDRIPQAGGVTNDLDADTQNDLDYLIQITNLNNRGTIKWDGVERTPRISPNAIDRGWVPMIAGGGIDDGTNIVWALWNAYSELSNVANCPSSSKKSIILASDGISNCKFNEIVVSANGDITTTPTSYHCGTSPANKFDYYTEQEDQILNHLLKLFKSKQIAVSVLMDGSYLGPHIYNRTGPGHTYDIEEFPYATLPDSCGTSQWYECFFDKSSSCGSLGCCSGSPNAQNKCAFENAGREPGVEFRRPFVTMAQLALGTGGVFCPLFPQCTETILKDGAASLPAGCATPFYEDDDGNPNTPDKLKEACRKVDQKLKCSVLDLNKSEQAVNCSLETLGTNPFVLANLQ